MRKLENYVPTKFMLPTSHYDKEKADKAVFFIENLCHTKGMWAGKKFELIDWQEKIVRDIFGTVKENGYRQFNTAYIEISKKNGKALALETPIPTPEGFKLMRDINVGDKVFDENGNVCSVIATTDIMNNEDCYEILFENGDKIIADANHKWMVNAWKDGKNNKKHIKNKEIEDRVYNGCSRSVRTTEEMSKNVLVYKNNTHNYSININAPLKLPHKDLIVPPYTLGCWLGDGSTYNAAITQCEYDEEIFDYVRAEGVPVRKGALNTGTKNTYRYSLTDKERKSAHNDCIQIRMKKIGVLCNKHIPQEYLRASVEQRLELLRGLMDTDGTCSKRGECEFTTIRKQLNDDVIELLRSLGIKAKSHKSIAKLNGKECGHKYRIHFFTDKRFSCFHLKRKYDRLKDEIGNTRSKVNHILKITKVKSVPVKCIQVDSNSHCYLCGKSMIPTHNSELSAAIALYLLCADDEQRAEVYGAAGDRQQASIVFDVAADMVRMSPYLSPFIKILSATKRLIFENSNSFYQVLSAEVATKHGYNVSGMIMDEVHVQPNRKLYDVLTKGSGDARMQPLYFLITTAGDDVNSICYELHQKAKDILEGRKVDHTFYPVIYGAEMDDDWSDEKVWAKANPSLGITFDIEKVRTAYEQARQNPAEENIFRQLRLNQWVKQSVRWMPMEHWDKCETNIDFDSLVGRECYGGLDLSSTTDITAFVLIFPPRNESEKYIIYPHFWIPEETVTLRTMKDHVPYDVWVKQGLINVTEGNVVHYAYIEKYIEELGKKYNIKEIAFDRWGATQMVQNLDGMGFTVIPFGQGFKDMTPPCKELYKLVLETKIAHNGHKVLRWMMDNIAAKTDAAGNVKFDKEKSSEKIDGAVALVMALDRCTRNMNKGGSVYDTRGILYI